MRIGAFSAMRLAGLLDVFKAQEELANANISQVPNDVLDHITAATVLVLLPRIALRVSGLHLKTAEVSPWLRDCDFPHRASLELQFEDEYLSLGIAMDDRLAMASARGLLCCEENELENDDVEDALAEFLNILIGTTKTVLCEYRAESSMHLGTPDIGQLPDSGYKIKLASPSGEGLLVLDLR